MLVIQLLQNLISENNSKHRINYSKDKMRPLTVTLFRESGASKDNDNKNFLGVNFQHRVTLCMFHRHCISRQATTSISTILVEKIYM